MCIALPEKILSTRETEAGVWARTERAGFVHETDLSLLEPVRPGDYVLVFRGAALRRVEKEEAERIEAALRAVSAAADGVEDTSMIEAGFSDLGNPDDRLPPHLKALASKAQTKATENESESKA